MNQKENITVTFTDYKSGYFTVYSEEFKTTKSATFKVSISEDNRNLCQIAFDDDKYPVSHWVQFANSEEKNMKENFKHFLELQYL